MASAYPYPKHRALVAAVTGAVLAASAAVLLPAAVAHGGAAGPPVTFSLPAPTGPERLGTFDLHLVDHARDDPWEPTDAPRELMVSAWYPAEHVAGAPYTPYMPEGIARFYDQASADLGVEQGEVDFAGVVSHAQTRAPLAAGGRGLPVVLYSPGGGMSRAMGTTLVEELASRGYVVVTVDSTYQAPVEFPDGMEMPAHGVDRGQALRERVRDIGFVLDTLAALRDGGAPDVQGRPVPRGLGAALDLSRVGMFGHSMGGFATAEAMRTERRIDAGINLDGSMPTKYGRAGNDGVDRPFLLMGAGEDGDRGTPHSHVGAPDWTSFWDRTTGWKRDFYLPEGEHMSFTDLQVMLPRLDAQIGLDDDAVREAIGTVDPQRSSAAQRAYVSAFFDRHLRGRPEPLLDGSSPAHPDVRRVR